MRKFVGILFGTVLFLLLAALPGAAYEYGPPSPTGLIGLRHPEIGLRLILGVGETINSVEMTLDGVQVEPFFDAATGLLTYTPVVPLEDGEHRVRMVVIVNPASSGFTYRPLVEEFTFFVQGSAVTHLPDAHPEGMRAVVYLNVIRNAAGLPPVRWEKALGAAAASHGSFLVRNPAQRNTDPHSEVPGRAGFTGETAGDRARYWAWNEPTSEVIHFQVTAEEAIDGWMESLYHRIPLISPAVSRIGYAVAGGEGEFVQVMNLSGPPVGDGVVLWPAHGAADVPLGWTGLEQPDPFRLYDGWKGPVGYTVTATFPGQPLLDIDTLELRAPDGQLVPVYAYTPQNDPLLSDTVAVIPRQPLAPNTKYEAHFAGTVDGRPWSRTWSFTTGTDMRPMFLSRSASFDGLHLGEIQVEGNQFVPGMQVYLDGLPVRSLSVDSSTQIRFTPPQGLAAGRATELLVVMPSGLESAWPGFFDGREGFMTADEAPPFTLSPLFVDGERAPVDALIHANGLLLPAAVLERAGARRDEVPATGRVYWHYGGRMADVLPGRPLYWVDGIPAVAPIPARKVGDLLYVPEGLVRSLIGDRILVMRDIGGHWAEPQVAQLVSRGIVSGYEDWTFRPGAQITRGAFLKMLVTARGLMPEQGLDGGFADVSGHWVAAQGWVGAAAKAGIVRPTEYANRLLDPDRPITREEMAVMVVRALGLEAEAQEMAVDTEWVGDRRFTDIDRWTRPGHVALAVELGIITGYEGGFSGEYEFRPAQEANRAEAAVMVVRMLSKM